MFDSHVHLDACPDPAGAAARASAAGVGGFLNPAADLAAARRALALHRADPRVLPALGLHPLHLGALAEPPLAELSALAAEGPFAAVGEVGLDFGAGRGDEDRQRRFLAAQAGLAKELGLPLVLHLHRGFYEGFAVLEEAGFDGPAVCHGFSGSREMARHALDRGGFLGAGAALLRPSATRLREVFACLPRERVLVETDAPPPPGRTAPGRQPWELPRVVGALAELWRVPAAEAAALTAATARRLFGRGR